MKIKKSVLKQIDASQGLKGEIADAMNRSSTTVQRWVDTNAEELLNLKSLNKVVEKLNLPLAEIVED